MSSIDITIVSGVPVFVDIVSTTIDIATTSGDTTTVVITSGTSIDLTLVSGATTIVEAGIAGIQGPMGPSGPFYGVPFFIQSGTPTPAQYSGYTTYAWWQISSGNTTLWIEDGL